MLPFFILGLVTILPFIKVLCGREMYFFADIATQNYPWKVFFAEHIHRFRLPLWFPYMHSGFPLYAEIQAGTFYPPNWLAFFLLPTPFAYGLLLALHLFLASCFSFLFARRLGLSKAASLFSAIVFSMGAFFVTHLVHLAMFVTAVWLPVEFYLMEKALARRDPVFLFIAMAPVIAFQILAGHPQIVSYTLLSLTLYLARGCIKEWIEGNRKYGITMLLCWMATVGFGVLLSAIQLLPTMQLIHHTTRAGGVGMEFASEQSMPPWALITYLFPDFFGYATPQRNVDYWLFGINYWELCSYVGVPTLLLSIVPLFDRPVGYWRFFYFLLGFAIILMMGDHTPLYGLLRSIPPFHYFRAPVRISLLVTFCLSIVSGRGLEVLVRAKTNGQEKTLRRSQLLSTWAFFTTIIGLFLGCIVLEVFHERIRSWLLRYGANFVQKHIYNKELFFKSREYYLSKLPWAVDTGLTRLQKVMNPLEPRVLIGISLLAGVVILLWLFRKGTLSVKGFSSGCVLLIAVDLLAFGLRYNPSLPISEALSAPSVVEPLKTDPSSYRVFRDVRCEQMSIEREKELLPDSMGSLWKICSADEFTPLRLQRYQELLQVIHKDRDFILYGRISHLNLLSLLNVKYFLSCLPVLHPDMREIYRKGTFRVYQNDRVLPRAFLLTDYKVITDRDIVRKTLEDPTFDFSRTVILEDYPPFPGVESSSVPLTAAINPITMDEDSIELDVRSRSGGMLVLGESYYPGWHARVDGTPARIYRANYVYQGVYVTAGSHRIRFQYLPTYLEQGARLSLLGIAVWTAVAAYTTLKARRRAAR